jgi:hypothetical protein
MEKYTLLKNKPETFNCQFNIDGADPNEAVVRLCLEFEDNKNMFFYGELKEDGNCEINIPSLKDIKQNEGKLVIEVIADSTYFRVHEADVELKNSVEVKMANVNGFAKTKPNVKVEQVSVKPVIKETVKEKEEVKQEETSPNPYRPKSSKLKSFSEFKRS